MHFLIIRITGVDLPTHEIISILGKQFKIKCHKSDSLSHSDLKEVKNNDIIIIDHEVYLDNMLNKEIEIFINTLYDYKDYFKKLAANYSLDFWISIYPENIQMSFCLPSTSVGKLVDMGIDTNVSISCMQQFYNGEYEHVISSSGDGSMH